MTTPHTPRRTAVLARWALALALSVGAMAMAQGEATLDQVYQAAEAGRVEQALQMMQPVLKAHPGSGKAHFMQAELLARQGQATEARAELRLAEQLAPGLPFAKTEAVQHLQRALGRLEPRGQANSPAAASPLAHAAAPAGLGISWGVVLALAGGAFVAWLLMRLGRSVANPAPASPVATPRWSAPGGEPAVPTMGPMNAAYPSPSGAMAPPAQTGGLGSRMAGGLATGLAVGAGLVAAEAIGKNLFGGAAHAMSQPAVANGPAFDPMFGDTSANRDMGDNDFGIRDTGSWDDVAPDSSDWDA